MTNAFLLYYPVQNILFQKITQLTKIKITKNTYSKHQCKLLPRHTRADSISQPSRHNVYSLCTVNGFYMFLRVARCILRDQDMIPSQLYNRQKNVIVINTFTSFFTSTVYPIAKRITYSFVSCTSFVLLEYPH